jgi:hypothetical protein
MHHEASPTVEEGSPSVTLRRRARRGIGVLAVLMNVVLFAAGLYFQAHARDRRDLWTAGGVAGVAVLNSAALTVSRRGPGGARVVDRLRRISLFANSILLVVAAVIVAFASLREWLDAALHGTLLFFPPLLTLLALRRYPQG